MGIENDVVGSSSIEVNRRKRRAKTDCIDGEHLLTKLMRYRAGERGGKRGARAQCGRRGRTHGGFGWRCSTPGSIKTGATTSTPTLSLRRTTAFVGSNGNPNENQWDVGSDPHGMAVAATIVGSRFVDDLNEGGWGEGFATGAAGTYAIPGVAPGAQIIPVKVCEPIGCWGSAINEGWTTSPA